MARQRDYKAEYARRVERGRELGLSRSQARGHPGKGQQPAKAVIAEIRKVTPEKVKPKRPAKQQKQPSPKVPSRKKSVAGGRNVIIKGRGKHGKDRQGVAWQGKGERSLLKKVDELAQATPSRPLWLSVQNDDGIWCDVFSEWAASHMAQALHDASPLKEWLELMILERGTNTPTLPDDFAWEVMALV